MKNKIKYYLIVSSEATVGDNWCAATVAAAVSVAFAVAAAPLLLLLRCYCCSAVAAAPLLLLLRCCCSVAAPLLQQLSNNHRIIN